jgi:hypothetical protein
MTESAKTLTFIAAAVLSLGAAFISRPSVEQFDAQSAKGEKLNQFEVDDAKRLRIVSFDQDTASTREFEVAEENGVWVIPSKHGYPADAVRQMGAAATCLIDREVLRVAAETASQHAELGLVDPTSSKLDTNATGVGIRVTMTNIDGQPLTDMIIGKKVPDTLDQYYVRNADQDVAYVVQLEPEHLTTKFDNWIEKDLLGLNPLDIRRLHIKDYTAELMVTMQGLGVKWDRRSELELRYDDEEGKWSAERLQAYDSGKKEMVEFTLAEDEELDEEALRELRYGLDDLSIVDVERKPAGLSADLKAGSGLMKDFESLSSLVQRGFAPMEGSGADQLDILSTEGEIVCTLQDGVEYVLRFGNLQMDGDAPEADAKAAEADPNSADDDGIHRYLFVMARFNEDELKQPKLQELPALPEGANENEQEETEEAETAASKPEESAEAEEKADESAAESDEAKSESAATADEKDEDAQKDDAEKKDDDLETLIAERKRIEDENQRLLQEYQDKRKAAEERVKELNERFGDWYYVIDNKVFKKIHLGRDDVIKAKEKADEKAEGDTASPAADLPGVPNLPGSP